MSKKRRREHPPVDTRMVEIYEDLTNADEKIRLKAAHNLLSEFIHQGKASGEQLNEIVRRLIRGLCSSRKAARLGFSIALTELLVEILGPRRKHVEGFQTVAEVIETLKRQTHVAGNVSGQEERDHQFGRLFGAEAIMKSRILLEPSISIDIWGQLLDLVYDLAKKKPWLREECGFILFTSVQMLQERDLKHAQLILDKLHENGLLKTSEGVAIWIALQSKFSSLRFPREVWHREDPMNHKEMTVLAKILKEAPVKEDANGQVDFNNLQKGAWSSKLHFAWDVILTKLLNTDLSIHSKGSKKSKRVDFAAFWERCVDGEMFAAASSEERKYLGFLLFLRVIANAPVDTIPSIFSKNFMRSLMNQLASPERYLHRTAVKAKHAILARARSTPDVRSLILKALLTAPNGDPNFDKITKSKTIESLLSHMDGSSLERIATIYNEIILHPGVQDEIAATFKRTIAADQLISAVRNLAIESSVQGFEISSLFRPVEGVLTMLASYAYFDLEGAAKSPRKRPDPPISQASRNIFRSRILSCLTHLTSQSIYPSCIFYNLISMITSEDQNSSSGKLLLDADDTVKQVISTALERLKEISSETENPSPEPSRGDYHRSLTLLYSLVLVQMYNEDAEAVSILEELNDMQDLEGGSGALVEILLSFSSKPSQLFRRLTQQVFTTCAPDIDGIGLQSMFKVLDTRESLSGQAEMFEQEVEALSVTEGSDVEMVDMEDASSGSPEDVKGSSDEDESEASSESIEADSEGNDDELAVFNAKLAQALGTRPGNEDLDAEDSSSSDEDMNSEQMEALDGHLGQILRERKNITSKRTERKDAKETIVNFKCRVLELLEIYAKQQHANSLALSLLLPLLKVIRTTTSPQVSSKACNVMREYARVCKGSGVPNAENLDAIYAILESVHAEAMKEGSNAYVSACSQASLLLVRVLVAHDRECLRRVVRIYGDTEEKALFDANCKVKTAFFTDWLNWCTSARK